MENRWQGTPEAIGQLAAALATARDRVEVATKDGANAHHGFKYTTYAERMFLGKQALKDTGLSLVCLGSIIREAPAVMLEGVQGKYGVSGRAQGICVMHVAWVHSSGAMLDLGDYELPIVPEQGRPADKAKLSAESELLGYIYRTQLCIPSFEGDVSGRNDDAPEQPAKPSKPEQPSKPKTPTQADIVAGLDAATSLDVFGRWYKHARAAAKAEPKSAEPITQAVQRAQMRIGRTLQPAGELRDALTSGDKARIDAALSEAGIVDKGEVGCYLAWSAEMGDTLPPEWVARVRGAQDKATVDAARKEMATWESSERKRKALAMLTEAEHMVKARRA